MAKSKLRIRIDKIKESGPPYLLERNECHVSYHAGTRKTTIRVCDSVMDLDVGEEVAIRFLPSSSRLVDSYEINYCKVTKREENLVWCEIFSIERLRYEELFDEFMDMTEFTLIKHPDGMWSVYDRQGANLGGINGDRHKDAAGIFERMDIYINDTFIGDLEECLEAAGFEVPEWKTIDELAKYARPLLPDNKYCCDTLDMIAKYADKIDLNNCFYEKAEEFWSNYDLKDWEEK